MTQPAIDLPAVRRLASLTLTAGTVLVPLSSDGRGADSHGGAIQNPVEALDRALDALEAAGTLAARLRAAAGRCAEGSAA